MYVQLWWRFCAMGLARESEYRMNFVINVLESILGLGLGVLAYGIMYSFTESVAGWSKAEVLILLGIAQIVVCLINLLFGGNMFNIADYIREGDMDYILGQSHLIWPAVSRQSRVP
jgi:ABC-2 type transport system permease protein